MHMRAYVCLRVAGGGKHILNSRKDFNLKQKVGFPGRITHRDIFIYLAFSKVQSFKSPIIVRKKAAISCFKILTYI